jgi:hypothetical protein
MYEQYIDKQIVEMLVPKLKKAVPEVNWDAIKANPDFHSVTNKMIATIYRSAYIRGQLGRSFIIGEKNKQNGHWVPATRDNVKKGDKVRFVNEQLHKKHPQYFPCKGTVGEVRTVCKDGLCDVQWPKGTTSDMDWWVTKCEDLEVLLCE